MHSNGQTFQHTLATEFSISGPGIHTGHLVNMVVKPAAPNTGINFQRVDLEDRPVVKADVDNVVMTNRSTAIESNGARIYTIEHLMAAFVGMGVDNALVELDGDEVPILDGSAHAFVEAIEKAGVKQQEVAKIFYNIEHNITFVDEERGVEMVALPFTEYRVNALIDFNSPVLGTQHASLKDIKDFKNEIAPCRTFCFFHELEWLLDHDLIKGGDRNNAVVVVDKPVTDNQVKKLKAHFPDIEIPKGQGYLNNAELRFDNEPARHKLLDVIGDLALVGFAFNAHIIASKPGHAANVMFAKKLKEHIKKVKQKGEIPVYDPTKPPLFDVHAIEKLLPHRFPFLLVDKIIELTDTKVVGIKNVTYNEPFFQGHFPGNCVMPGVLLAEALAQCGGILAIPKDTEDKYDTYFLKIDNCKFKQKVVPGDTLILHMELVSPIRRGLVEMKGTIYVAGKIAAEAILVAQIVKRTKQDD
ncbi:bifunctional UDP-3-O-[3-hydroxymyristoyl] N-acetylglucosamine deacetylase/3-hydroxyacyl-ACP dehydratase [Aridibaculum aurantiacum]|uniref:bifunctional UDP-3-O-[3-hydroxymyristoyl] N-acetylglucosamine deacetylase/3-hydroxyacyl-ACP dehydratase n=1 Tax=Aridibaculum aurantiacum TaxID=2810307 RepID=UPI001A96437C|nr:bifunctional UDP-3-O-[3-hydroxymyristoyl] N-acetylglucosamine deacetylase/3-hydroxyacyl-ACP dehydratase [Aridibaculum aurantiacum]